jgi:2-polyprenyl-6-methoxyphenol hydroxylase-like FAD-dependent oxidoreductase
VHPSTLQLLEELGLGDRFARLPQNRIDEGDEVVIADLSRLRTAHPYIAMVPQWDLLNLWAEAGEQEPTFTLRMRTEAVELLRDGRRVRGVRYRTADGATGEITAVAGVQSSLRNCGASVSTTMASASLVAR